MSDPRVQRALAALAAAGLPHTTLSVEGQEGEIAALSLPPAEWEAVLGAPGAAAAAAVKAAGFRYVTLDLAPADPPAGEGG